MDESKVLIVDDEVKNIKLLKGILFSENYRIYEASSGEVAIDLVHSIRPDLILLDVMMPGISGFEVCRQLKQDEKTKTIPIIMVTALREKEHRLKALESGGDDFLSKPVDSTEVVVRVKSLLRIKSYHDEISNNYKEIAAKNEKLLELEKTKDGLMHMIVHDLRTPLGAIFGFIDIMLLNKQRLAQDQIKALEKCIDFCQELKEMIESLLSIYKLEEGKMKLNIETANMEDMIDETVQQFFVKSAEKQIALSYDRSNRHLIALADSRLVKRVLANLLNNAIRHTPFGGRIKIFAESDQINDNLHIKVVDNGDGISSEYHQKIFDKFEQVKLKKSGIAVGASGLGLAFCKLAVEGHGGRIWVESEGEGEGSSFQFTLPAK